MGHEWVTASGQQECRREGQEPAVGADQPILAEGQVAKRVLRGYQMLCLFIDTTPY